MKNCWRNPALVLGLVVAWRLVLLLLTQQPIPANDAYFFDGPAVNAVNHGRFCNPSIDYFTPYSATNIFCAYPPTYPLTMRVWMTAAGTGVMSAMTFHMLLFAVYAAMLLVLFRELKAPAWTVHWGALFLLTITFDDRPDSLSQVFGLFALWLWLRLDRLGPWSWLPGAVVTLTLWTTPEVGGIYFGLLGLVSLIAWGAGQRKLPWLGLACLIVLPPASVGLFWRLEPDLWAGFIEHARQTPSLTHFRLASYQEWLKVVRAIPGALLVMGWLAWRQWRGPRPDWRHPLAPLVGALAGATLVVAGGALTIFTADWIGIARYLQPMLVTIFLLWQFGDGLRPARNWVVMLAGCALLAAVRAIGLSTWGVACAADVSSVRALQIVDARLTAEPAGSRVVCSSAFLYRANDYSNLETLHEDWLHLAGLGNSDVENDRVALEKIRPASMLLTQYDYYRRYRLVLAELSAKPRLVTLTVSNYARLQPPDAYPSLQRVLQHVAWAPVVVDFNWQPRPAESNSVPAPRN